MNFLNIEGQGLALEAIDFQTPEFAETIVGYIDKIFKCKNGKEADASDEAKKMKKAFLDKTGMNLQIKFNTDDPPCMMPVHINPDSILGDDFFKRHYATDGTKIIKDIEKLNSGTIDLRNAKVTGIFSSLPVDIYMGFDDLKRSGLSSREIAAVLMHEVGHAFVGFELTFNTLLTNQILLAAHKSLVNKDHTQYEYVLKTTERVLGENSGIYTELKDETDSKVVTVVLMTKFNEKRRSELGTAAYDYSAYEALADNFATRMGLGRELVTGLETILRIHGAPEYHRGTRITILVVQVVMNVYLSVLGIIGGPVGMLIMGALIFLLMTWGSSDGAKGNNTYDKLTIRYRRIREQIINYLKNRNLDQKLVKKLLQDLNVIDKVIEDARDYTSFYGVIGNIIYPSNWVLSSRKNTQRVLEELAANDLYVKVAQLRSK